MEREDIEELRWHAAGNRAELPTDGGGLTVRAGGRHVALFLHEGEVHAVDDACPHMGASLGMGVAIDGDVTCPWHAWHFRLGDGCNTDGLEARVAVHPVRVASDGSIEVGLPRAQEAAGTESAEADETPA
jgi:nitrite reductase (NADH) small subunit/3-phenylpropionate/trans-cinnamate dioxygenase ferredoxin subunit